MLFTDQATRVHRRNACTGCANNVEEYCVSTGSAQDIKLKSKYPLAICDAGRWGEPIMTRDEVNGLIKSIENFAPSMGFGKRKILNPVYMKLTGFELCPTCPQDSQDFLKYLQTQAKDL